MGQKIKMSDKNFEELSLLLSKQLRIQNKLLSLENGKTKVIVAGDITKLDEILRQQEPLILNCAGLESRRKQVLKEIGLDGLTMRQVLDEIVLDPDDAIKSKVQDLAGVLRRLKKANDINKRLLNCRLMDMKQYMSLIGFQEPALTYDQNGRF